MRTVTNVHNDNARHVRAAKRNDTQRLRLQAAGNVRTDVHNERISLMRLRTDTTLRWRANGNVCERIYGRPRAGVLLRVSSVR